LNQVLVTGSSGFIGRNLSKHLSELGFIVKLLDSDYFKDIDWQNSLLDILETFDPKVIFHVGACSNTLELNVQYMMEQNYQSTKLISDWCNEKRRKLIFSSSAANYGINGKYPSNLYGWSKYVAEDYVRISGGIALRYFNVYGPGEESKGAMSSFLYQAYINKNNGEKVLLFPGGPSRDFIYIKDVVGANLYALKNFFDLTGKYYDVATGHSRLFEDMLNLADIEFVYSDESKIPAGYQFYTCGDPKKWMDGWKPDYSLEEGVADYLTYLHQPTTSQEK
jgi:ADP-L-glycero-D-manno-heptose 6-epimerase